MLKPKKSKYRGVSWHKNKNFWQVKIKFDGTAYHFGYYTNEKYAARMYDALALRIWGNDSVLNFDGKPPAGVCQVDIIEKLRKKGLKG